MKAIYASKFYKASSKSRQDNIRAAINDPINKELVQQLREYIDDDELLHVAEMQKSEEASKEEGSVSEGQNTDESKSEKASSEDGSIRKSGGSKIPADHHLSNMLKEEEGGDEGVPADAPEQSSEPVQKEESTETVSESTNIEDSTEDVTSSLTADAKLMNINACEDISTQTDSIAGMLNAVAETAGVRRCAVKPEKELWIYYNDSINLNNIMEPVISLLNASDYSYLDFNRLARTDNAIVFSISETKKPVEPMQETDEK
jgi:hypothetical protein